MRSESFHILGAGAIGNLLGFYLHQSGYSITLLMKDTAHYQPHQRHQICFQPYQSLPKSYFPLIENPDSSGLIENLIVTVKAFQTEEAIHSVVHRITANTNVFVIQNGMGSLDGCLHALATQRIYLGTTTHGAYRTDKHHIVHAGVGKVWLGVHPTYQEYPIAKPQHLINAMEEAQLFPYWTDQIQHHLWKKLTINCCINAITALIGGKNEMFVNHLPIHSFIQQVCAEVQWVATQQGIVDATLFSWKQVLAVAQATAENYSSMLQDVSNGKRTEIEFMNGYVVREARKFQREVPYNRLLIELMRMRNRKHE